ncbi:complement component C1q receptor [Parambassis ranga]|uniref:Complement component C1q receptor n=1 Tax=Parambassis ranga TaxID=210632 RepID=A0A6P7HA72_9TELE|nr:complement component C1q receptor-like [Parambassis ranga]
MAIMLWIFLLQLIHSFDGLSGVEHETLCTSKACLTLHMEKVTFGRAKQNCEDNGGYLMTVRDRQEEDVLLSLLSLSQTPHQDNVLTFWIGLKLHKQDCVLPNKALKGFKWVSGEEGSHYSNWKKDPVLTCTSERCVMVDYTSPGPNRMKWTTVPCKQRGYYVCKFSFKGMCNPLILLGPGEITYTPPFSKEPQKGEMKLLPLATYANILCSDEQSYYSVCMELDDTYSWTNPGPFCKIGNQNCELNNGGCEHLCQQDGDNVQCFCKKGFDLGKDGFSCRIKNMCGPDTCEHQCVMGVSGYFCKCPAGFELNENQRNCSDIDECQSQACNDDVCVNTHGSYTCVCKDGYEMTDGKCRGVDECMQSRCEHGCLNNLGSFSCYCNEGFTLSKDGLSCEDINECISNTCFDDFICVNTMGSFLCTYPEGFFPDIDGSTYAPHVTSQSATSLEKDTLEDFTESLTRTTVELQHQSPHTDAPLPDLVNNTNGHNSNASLVSNVANTVNSRVIICVLGSVIPLLLLVAVTLFIALYRCSRTKKEAKKNTTADGYCWVSSGLDPRLEKLYESILTDDL